MLSAVVVTQNEEANIARCLASVQFADEILVVDALSEDDTAGLAKKLGARVLSQAWQGFAAQKQYAVDQARGDWILLIDSDEEVSRGLADEIEVTLQKESAPNGFKLRRRNQFLGAWMDHGPWAHDYQLRLFRKTEGKIARRPVHEGVQLRGDPGTLENPLNHYTHQTLSESVGRLNRYTTLEALERTERRRIRPVEAVIAPAGVFLRYYLLKDTPAGA